MSAASRTKPRVAVVGARGFVGSRLSQRLGADGVSVRRFTRDRPPLGADGALHPWLREVDVVFYLAASVTSATAERRPDLVSADHDAFTRLLDGLASCERSPLVVFSSSAFTVCESGGRRPVTEETPALPRSAYAKAKLRLEGELRDRGSSVPSVIVRLTNVYGPGLAVRQGNGVITHWLDAARQGRPLCLYGSPEAERDYIFVDDLVDALLRFTPDTVAGLPHRLFHIGSGRATSLGQLLDIVRRVVGADVPVERYPGRTVDHPAVLLDVSRAHALLGWRARTPLESGLAATWQCFRATATR